MNLQNLYSGVMDRLRADQLERYGIFILMVVASFSLSGQMPPNSKLDPSWQVVMDFGATHNMAFGKELIFTYGPLGYLFGQYGLNSHVLMRVFFSLCFSGVFAALITSVACREFEGTWLRWFWGL